jgi:hypothetical protein
VSVQEDEAEDADRYILKISMSIDGSESGLIGIPLLVGWGLYGPEPECTVVELSGEFNLKLGPPATRCVGSSSRRLEPMRLGEFY